MARIPDIQRKTKVVNAEGKEVEVTKGEACIEARKIGAPLRDCAAYAGISAATLHNWAAKGREHRPDEESDETLDDVDPKMRAYVEFLEQMEEAESSTVVVTLAALAKRVKEGDTKAITWLLERTRRREFGPESKVNLSGKIDVNAERERAEKMSEAELDESLVGVDPTEEST